VSFIDFGMSDAAQSWCRERGECIALNLDMDFIKPKEEIHPDLVRTWDGWVDRWNSRKAWFKKPFALLQSPYRKGVWLDLDCEVLGPIDVLFSQYGECELAMAREYRSADLAFMHPDIVYNGGVIVFQHGSCLIQKWAEDAITRNHQFLGDDFLLSALIYEKGHIMTELPDIYNWRIVNGINLNAVIMHWVGKKNFIKEFRGIKPALQDFVKCVNGKELPRKKRES
jgi:hypothetical protein